MGVVLTYCSGGTVRSEFMEGVIEALTLQPPLITRYFGMRAGPQASMARNAQARRFMEQTSEEWLWMVDTDIVLAGATLPLLLGAADPQERPVVGGLYAVQPDPFLPEGRACIYLGGREEAMNRFAFVFADDWPRDRLVQVGATGCGCLLVHRSAFERLAAHDPDWDGHWFSLLNFDRREFGEDMSFCLRLSVAGIPLYVHTGARVGHVKTVTLVPGEGTMDAAGEAPPVAEVRTREEVGPPW